MWRLILVDYGTTTRTAVAQVVVFFPILVVGMGHYMILERTIICAVEVIAAAIIGLLCITRHVGSSLLKIGGVRILRGRRKSAQVVLDLLLNGARCPPANLLFSERALYFPLNAPTKVHYLSN